MESNTATAEVPMEHPCADCETSLTEGMDLVTTEGGIFCRPCYNNLRSQAEQAIRDQNVDVNYPMALMGGLLGGTLGVLAWWGITVMTNIAFGLVAIVIGLAVGKGVTLLSGDKRSRGLQVLSIIIAGLSFFYASYLVKRTFVMQAMAEGGEEIILPLLPSPDLFFNVVFLDFGLFEVLFLGIVLWEAWKMPAPLMLK